MDIAIDNSVISHYLKNKPNTDTEKKDINAFEQILELAQKGVFELGGPVSTLMIENQMMAGELRKCFIAKLKGIIKYWPVVDPDQNDTHNKIICLHKIMQDKNQEDTKQLVLVAKLSQARYLIKMDYRFVNRFNDVKNNIIQECSINMFVMTPSEFLEKYNNREI